MFHDAGGVIVSVFGCVEGALWLSAARGAPGVREREGACEGGVGGGELRGGRCPGRGIPLAYVAQYAFDYLGIVDHGDNAQAVAAAGAGQGIGAVDSGDEACPGRLPSLGPLGFVGRSLIQKWLVLTASGGRGVGAAVM